METVEDVADRMRDYLPYIDFLRIAAEERCQERLWTYLGCMKAAILYPHRMGITLADMRRFEENLLLFERANRLPLLRDDLIVPSPPPPPIISIDDSPRSPEVTNYLQAVLDREDYRADELVIIDSPSPQRSPSILSPETCTENFTAIRAIPLERTGETDPNDFPINCEASFINPEKSKHILSLSQDSGFSSTFRDPELHRLSSKNTSKAENALKEHSHLAETAPLGSRSSAEALFVQKLIGDRTGEVRKSTDSPRIFACETSTSKNITEGHTGNVGTFKRNLGGGIGEVNVSKDSLEYPAGGISRNKSEGLTVEANPPTDKADLSVEQMRNILNMIKSKEIAGASNQQIVDDNRSEFPDVIKHDESNKANDSMQNQKSNAHSTDAERTNISLPTLAKEPNTANDSMQSQKLNAFSNPADQTNIPQATLQNRPSKDPSPIIRRKSVDGRSSLSILTTTAGQGARPEIKSNVSNVPSIPSEPPTLTIDDDIAIQQQAIPLKPQPQKDRMDESLFSRRRDGISSYRMKKMTEDAVSIAIGNRDPRVNRDPRLQPKTPETTSPKLSKAAEMKNKLKETLTDITPVALCGTGALKMTRENLQKKRELAQVKVSKPVDSFETALLSSDSVSMSKKMSLSQYIARKNPDEAPPSDTTNNDQAYKRKKSVKGDKSTRGESSSEKKSDKSASRRDGGNEKKSDKPAKGRDHSKEKKIDKRAKQEAGSKGPTVEVSKNKERKHEQKIKNKKTEESKEIKDKHAQKKAKESVEKRKEALKEPEKEKAKDKYSKRDKEKQNTKEQKKSKEKNKVKSSEDSKKRDKMKEKSKLKDAQKEKQHNKENQKTESKKDKEKLKKAKKESSKKPQATKTSKDKETKNNMKWETKQKTSNKDSKICRNDKAEKKEMEPTLFEMEKDEKEMLKDGVVDSLLQSLNDDNAQESKDVADVTRATGKTTVEDDATNNKDKETTEGHSENNETDKTTVDDDATNNKGKETTEGSTENNVTVDNTGKNSVEKTSPLTETDEAMRPKAEVTVETVTRKDTQSTAEEDATDSKTITDARKAEGSDAIEVGGWDTQANMESQATIGPTSDVTMLDTHAFVEKHVTKSEAGVAVDTATVSTEAATENIYSDNIDVPVTTEVQGVNTHVVVENDVTREVAGFNTKAVVETGKSIEGSETNSENPENEVMNNLLTLDDSQTCVSRVASGNALRESDVSNQLCRSASGTNDMDKSRSLQDFNATHKNDQKSLDEETRVQTPKTCNNIQMNLGTLPSSSAIIQPENIEPKNNVLTAVETTQVGINDTSKEESASKNNANDGGTKDPKEVADNKRVAKLVEEFTSDNFMSSIKEKVHEIIESAPGKKRELEIRVVVEGEEDEGDQCTIIIQKKRNTGEFISKIQDIKREDNSDSHQTAGPDLSKEELDVSKIKTEENVDVGTAFDNQVTLMKSDNLSSGKEQESAVDVQVDNISSTISDDSQEVNELTDKPKQVVSSLKCQYCTTFSKGNLVYHHMTYHRGLEVPCHLLKHDIQNVDDNFLLFLKGLPNRDIFVESVHCFSCEFSTMSKKALLKHFYEHSVYICRFCGVKKEEPVDFFDHIAFHTGEYRYECDMCTYTAYGASMVKRHKTAKHKCKNSSGRIASPNLYMSYWLYAYVCGCCYFTQIKESAVRRHLEVVHQGIGSVIYLNMSSISFDASHNTSNIQFHEAYAEATSSGVKFVNKDEESSRANQQKSCADEQANQHHDDNNNGKEMKQDNEGTVNVEPKQRDTEDYTDVEAKQQYNEVKQHDNKEKRDAEAKQHHNEDNRDVEPKQQHNQDNRDLEAKEQYNEDNRSIETKQDNKDNSGLEAMQQYNEDNRDIEAKQQYNEDNRDAEAKQQYNEDNRDVVVNQQDEEDSRDFEVKYQDNEGNRSVDVKQHVHGDNRDVEEKQQSNEDNINLESKQQDNEDKRIDIEVKQQDNENDEGIMAKLQNNDNIDAQAKQQDNEDNRGVVVNHQDKEDSRDFEVKDQDNEENKNVEAKQQATRDNRDVEEKQQDNEDNINVESKQQESEDNRDIETKQQENEDNKDIETKQNDNDNDRDVVAKLQDKDNRDVQTMQQGNEDYKDVVVNEQDKEDSRDFEVKQQDNEENRGAETKQQDVQVDRDVGPNQHENDENEMGIDVYEDVDIDSEADLSNTEMEPMHTKSDDLESDNINEGNSHPSDFLKNNILASDLELTDVGEAIVKETTESLFSTRERSIECSENKVDPRDEAESISKKKPPKNISKNLKKVMKENEIFNSSVSEIPTDHRKNDQAKQMEELCSSLKGKFDIFCALRVDVDIGGKIASEESSDSLETKAAEMREARTSIPEVSSQKRVLASQQELRSLRKKANSSIEEESDGNGPDISLEKYADGSEEESDENGHDMVLEKDADGSCSEEDANEETALNSESDDDIPEICDIKEEEFSIGLPNSFFGVIQKLRNSVTTPFKPRELTMEEKKELFEEDEEEEEEEDVEEEKDAEKEKDVEGVTNEETDDPKVVMICDFSQCHCSFPEDEVLKHLKEHHGPFICCWKSCNLSYETAEAFISHVLVQHEVPPSYACKYCGFSFMELPALADHIDSSHIKANSFPSVTTAANSSIKASPSIRVRSDLFSSLENKEVPSEPPSIMIAQVCSIQQNEFNSKPDLSSMQNSLSLMKVNRLPPRKGFKSKTAHTIMCRKENIMKLFKCMSVQCVFSCDNADAFTNHLKCHNEDSYICCYCAEISPTAIESTAHIVNYHSYCPYQCPYCFYRALSDKYIMKHQEMDHANEKKEFFKCIVKTSAKPKHNKDVSKVFLNYRCRVGDCTFVNPIAQKFQQHLRDKHPFTAAYKCSYCTREWGSADKLISHHRTHFINELQCSYCLYGTKNRNEMLFHLSREHSNYPPKIFLRKEDVDVDTEKCTGPSMDHDYLQQSPELDIEPYAPTPCESKNILPPIPAWHQIETARTLPLSSMSPPAPPSLELPAQIFSESDDLEEGNTSTSHKTSVNRSESGLLEKLLVSSNAQERYHVFNTDILPQTNSNIITDTTTNAVPQTSGDTITSTFPLTSCNAVTDNVPQTQSGIKTDTIPQVPPNINTDAVSQPPSNTITKEEMPNSSVLIPSKEAISNTSVSPEQVKPCSNSTQNTNIGPKSDTDALPRTPVKIHSEGKMGSFDLLLQSPVIEGKRTRRSSRVPSSPGSSHSSPVKMARRSSKASDECNKENFNKDGVLEGLNGFNLYKCLYHNCDFAISDSTYLREHLMICDFARNHKDTMNCPHCYKSVKSTNQYLEHLKLHMSRKYHCSRCPYKGLTASYTGRHMKKIHGIQNFEVVEDGSESSYYILFPKDTDKAAIKKFVEMFREGATVFPTRGKYEFSPQDERDLPVEPVLSKDLKCSLCVFKTMVTKNMRRHLKQHTLHSANMKFCKIVPSANPVNPIPEKIELEFDKMKNLAGSSHNDNLQISVEDQNLLPKEVKEDKMYVCGMQDCTYMNLSCLLFQHHLLAIHNGTSIYPCAHCQENARPMPIDRLFNHFKLHGPKLYKCPHCFFHHFSKKSTEKHMKNKHPTLRQGVLTVREPNLEVKSEIVEPPVEQTVSQKWKCSMCVHLASSSTEAECHFRKRHHITGHYRCSLCNQGSKSKHTMELHFRSKHRGEECRVIENFSKITVPTTAIPEFNLHPKPLWSKSLQGTYRRHIRGIWLDDAETTLHSTVVVTPKCEPTTSESTGTIATPQAAPTDTAVKPLVTDKYSCTMCLKYTDTSAVTFKDHLYKCLNYKRYVCTFCKMMAHTIDGLKAHAAKQHPLKPLGFALITNPDCERVVDDILLSQQNLIESASAPLETIRKTKEPKGKTKRRKRPRCQDCDATFTSYKLLQAHIACEHPQNRLLCRICGALFTLEVNLARHMKQAVQRHANMGYVESGPKKETVKLYKCSDSGFTTKDSVVHTSHVRSSAKDLANPLKCKLCHVTCRSLEGMKKHTRTMHATAYVKEEVSEASVAVENLVEQGIGSSGAKTFKYVCTHCGFTGLTINSVRNHWRELHVSLPFQIRKIPTTASPQHSSTSICDTPSLDQGPESIPREGACTLPKVKTEEAAEEDTYSCGYCNEENLSLAMLHNHNWCFHSHLKPNGVLMKKKRPLADHADSPPAKVRCVARKSTSLPHCKSKINEGFSYYGLPFAPLPDLSRLTIRHHTVAKYMEMFQFRTAEVRLEKSDEA